MWSLAISREDHLVDEISVLVLVLVLVLALDRNPTAGAASRMS